jgi:hypothetical protein
MRQIETSTSTTLEIDTAEDFAVALEMLHEDALGLYDRDIASKSDVPIGKCKVQINTLTGEHRAALVRAAGPMASYVAGWIYVCETGFVYALTIVLDKPENSRWSKAGNVVLFNEPRQRIDTTVTPALP